MKYETPTMEKEVHFKSMHIDLRRTRLTPAQVADMILADETHRNKVHNYIEGFRKKAHLQDDDFYYDDEPAYMFMTDKDILIEQIEQALTEKDIRTVPQAANKVLNSRIFISQKQQNQLNVIEGIKKAGYYDDFHRMAGWGYAIDPTRIVWVHNNLYKYFAPNGKVICIDMTDSPHGGIMIYEEGAENRKKALLQKQERAAKQAAAEAAKQAAAAPIKQKPAKKKTNYGF